MSKANKIRVLISVIWLISVFVYANNESIGMAIPGEFASIFFPFGVIPVVILFGVYWIKDNRNDRQI